MFASIKIKVIIENIGIVTTKPLKYLIALEWCLTYNTAEPINKPELTKPWAIIIIIEAIIPSLEWQNIANVTKPICDTEEYAINLLISVCLQVVKLAYTIAIRLSNMIKGLKCSDAIGNKGYPNLKNP